MGEVQTILFPKDTYKVGEAREWLKMNKFIWNSKVDRERPNFLSFRQTEPTYKRYITKVLPNGVELIIGYK